jgi:RimJ/RimL family protein N-acetyltransferase
MRLVLREVRDEDLPVFFAFQREPAAVHMAAFTAKDPTDREAFEAHWDRIRSRDDILVRTIVVDDEVVGSVLSYVLEDTPEVSYWIGQDHWGRGIASAALRAFLSIQTHRPLLARVAKDNLASIRVLEKCGFRVRSEARGFANARGTEIEEFVMELG